jgi:cytochrome c-type biogenesis protein CcmE
MHKNTRSRLIIALTSLLFVSAGVYLILSNLNENITFFYPPSKISSELENKVIRVGGLVAEGSIENIEAGKIKFAIVDLEGGKLIVYFQGIPPALFRANQGIVAKGRLRSDIFVASELLTKHDENYRPPGQ